jgi:hypothetical protein
MVDGPIRDPAQIRADCARKLEPIETGGMFRALLAALLDEDWTTPRIEELFITSDRYILAWPTGEVTQRLYIGEEADLIRNVHGIAEVAGLDGDELGYLLGKAVQLQAERTCILGPDPPLQFNLQFVSLQFVSCQWFDFAHHRWSVVRLRSPQVVRCKEGTRPGGRLPTGDQEYLVMDLRAGWGDGRVHQRTENGRRRSGTREFDEPANSYATHL